MPIFIRRHIQKIRLPNNLYIMEQKFVSPQNTSETVRKISRIRKYVFKVGYIEIPQVEF